ncbi:MAG: ribosome biogenesis GTP-binding protein YihA/YsxC [Proteobacteria bacterium]|nr:ribosome biogenesis GTP-binding protein YihA/YsxC [Pseudomonadota bacterium]
MPVDPTADNRVYPVRRVSYLTSAVRPRQFPPADRPEVAFAGRSNVGKSSLINRLLERRALARTGKTPGRTQTVNFFNVNDELYFVDLPGYGYAKVPESVRASWRPMVESYLGAGRDLRRLVLLQDIRRDPGEEEKSLLDWLRQGDIPAQVVVTKADKISRGGRAARAAAIRKQLGLTEAPLLFSARTGEGREAVWSTLVRACGLIETEKT